MSLSDRTKQDLAMLADIRDAIRKYERAGDECTAEEFRRARRKKIEYIKKQIIEENAARR